MLVSGHILQRSARLLLSSPVILAITNQLWVEGYTTLSSRRDRQGHTHARSSGKDLVFWCLRRGSYRRFPSIRLWKVGIHSCQRSAVVHSWQTGLTLPLSKRSVLNRPLSFGARRRIQSLKSYSIATWATWS